MGYRNEEGDYIPDRGWCEDGGKGLGENTIERYKNPAGDHYGLCKGCFESAFKDRQDVPVTVQIKDMTNWSSREIHARWKVIGEWDGTKKEKWMIDGGIVFCSCPTTPKSKYFKGYEGALAQLKLFGVDFTAGNDELDWVAFGSGKCKHNTVDARTEWWKQHCDMVDAGERSRAFEQALSALKWARANERVARNRTIANRVSVQQKMFTVDRDHVKYDHLNSRYVKADNDGWWKHTKNGRGEFECNSLWENSFKASKGLYSAVYEDAIAVGREIAIVYATAKCEDAYLESYSDTQVLKKKLIETELRPARSDDRDEWVPKAESVLEWYSSYNAVRNVAGQLPYQPKDTILRANLASRTKMVKAWGNHRNLTEKSALKEIKGRGYW